MNVTSRVEHFCSEMGASVLATEEFVSRDGESEAWISRGEHDLKGIQNVVRVFELGAI